MNSQNERQTAPFFTRTLVLLWPLVFSACVSVDLGAKHVPGDAFKFTPPPAPFTQLDEDNLHQAWQNPKNGNSISVFSNCNEKADPTLNVIQKEILSVLENQRNEERISQVFNQREELVTTTSGKLDGFPIKMKVLSFKKNLCSYSLNYTATPSSFEDDINSFENFILGFTVP